VTAAPRRPARLADGTRAWLRAGEDPEKLARLLERVLAAVDAGAAQELKRGRRKALYAVRLDGQAFLLKSRGYRGLAARWRALRGSKARHELRVASALAARGIPTPVPLAAGERLRGARLASDHLLVARLAGASDLAEHWRSAIAPAERRRLVAALGALSRALHDAGLLQDDYAPNNFLVQPGAAPALLAIDFERARLSPRPASERSRIRMLAKLDRRVGAAASRADRLRFLHAYAGTRTEARAWWARVAASAPALARRDVRRWRRTAGADSRRFRRVASGRWHGFARRDADLARLVADVERAAGGLSRDGVAAGRGVWIALRRGTRPAEAERAWAAAHALWDGRGLAPRPLALLCAGDCSAVVLERSEQMRALSDAPGAASERAALVLAARLRALGALREPLPPQAVGVAWHPSRPPRALLLDPARWEPRAR
jgi:tRNA A-37 threonylcarbamoyl transferase component Bud32